VKKKNKKLATISLNIYHTEKSFKKVVQLSEVHVSRHIPVFERIDSIIFETHAKKVLSWADRAQNKMRPITFT
jgi:hypothetical protein